MTKKKVATRGQTTGNAESSRTASQGAGVQNGGPAFPHEVHIGVVREGRNGIAVAQFGGMSLRDYFAAQAIHAPWGEAITPEVYPNGVITPESVQALAANCYALADALLIEQAKGKP